MSGKKVKTVVFGIFLVIAFMHGSALGYVTPVIESSSPNFSPSQPLSGKVTLKYDECFDFNDPTVSYLQLCIDNCDSPKTKSLGDYILKWDEYDYRNLYPVYTLTSAGTMTWYTQPDQTFSYLVKVNGTCGYYESGQCCGGICEPPDVDACDCPCRNPNPAEDPYPCYWEDTTSFSGEKVNSGEGLKYMRDSSIAPPGDNNDDTVYEVTVTFNTENVEAAMKAACGGQTYEGHSVTQSGWVKRTGAGILLCTADECESAFKTGYPTYCSPETCAQSTNPEHTYSHAGNQWYSWDTDLGSRKKCIENFENISLIRFPGQVPYRAYGGPDPTEYFSYGVQPGTFSWHATMNPDGINMGGGVFKKRPGDMYWDYLSYDSDIIWNASHYSNNDIGYDCQGLGYIQILNWDPQSQYKIVYLPPMGNRVCAYTDVSQEMNDPWNHGEFTWQPYTSGVEMTIKDPWNEEIDKSTTESNLMPDCPVTPCDREITSYSGYVNNPGYFLQVNDNPIWVKIQVNLTTTKAELDYEYKTSIDFSEIPNLNAPPGEGAYELIAQVRNESGYLGLINSTTFNFTVGSDIDKDNYTWELGDCDDTDDRVYPGAPEICDGKDNNCDGEIDENYGNLTEGKKAGRPCYDWEGSACAGTWICNPEGTDLVCDSGLEPGDLEEICENQKDDDCDGETDEYEETVDGKTVMACTFSCENGRTEACGSNIGLCQEGYRICINHAWTECIDSKGPYEETCNGKDDDCDGTIDNVRGKESVTDTACGCYGGNQKSTEICNDIDDDCDGVIDEGITCCEAGDTRPCGTNEGICTQGTQSCENGKWGECRGGIKGIEEVCYDDIDNDCDGKTDEFCDIQVTCHNKLKDINELGVDCGGDCERECEDFNSWIVFALIIATIIIVAGFLEYTGKL